MTGKDVAVNYQRLRARGASPVGLVVLVYDAAIESLRRAKFATENGKIEDRVAASNHVVLVINELMRALDHERGGDVARRLDLFYAVARARLMEANLRSDAAIFDELIGMFCSLREAWHRVEVEVDGKSSAVAGVPAPGPAIPAGEASFAGWSA